MRGWKLIPAGAPGRSRLLAALGHAPLLLLLAAGVVLSVYAAETMADLDRQRREADFFRRAENEVAVLRRRLSEPIDVVAQLAAFYDASAEVTPEEFREYGDDVRRRHPEVTGLAWRDPPAADADGADAAALSAAARDARVSAIGPYPAPGGRTGPEYVLVRPVFRADDEGTYTLAGAPAELAGFVTVRLDLGGLGSDVRREAGASDVVLEVVEPGHREGATLLYRSPGIASGRAAEGPHLVRPLAFADRIWQVVCVPAAGTIDGPPGVARSLVLAGCLLLTGLAGILYLVLRRTSGIAALTRRQAERLTEEVAERKHAEERYRTLVDGAVFGILRTTASGRVLDANPALVGMFRYASEEEVRRVDLARDVYTAPGERARVLDMFRGKSDRSSATVHLRRADGTVGWFRVTGRAIPSEVGAEEVFESMVEDVTEATRLEEQLRRSRRVEAMGRLAGGVAHDFNNLLTVVLGQCRQLRESAALPAGEIERLDDIESCGERAARLTRQLLAFARQQVMRPRLLDLNAVVERLSPLLRRMIGEDIALRFEPTPEAGPVRVDPTQLEQVVMNLVLNARNSMPDGGEIFVSTGRASISGDESRGLLNEPGEYVVLKIHDTGVGMDEETRAHVFEPFFTTRASRGGTGLGLATAFGIVRQSGGFIWVWSEPGQGSTFEVHLPRASGEVAAEPPAPAADAAPTGGGPGTETILLAEDELSVLDLIRDAMTEEGYTVLPAENGAQAWRIFEERESEIDALVTDLVMPELRGDELARRIRRRRPDLPVLAMSGYSTHAVRSGGALGETAAFIEKPFDLADLLRTVRRMLDDRRRAADGLSQGRDGPDEERPDAGRDPARAGEDGGAGDREGEDEQREPDIELRDVVQPRPGQ